MTGRLQKKQKPVRSSGQSLWLGEGQDEVVWGSLVHSEPRSSSCDEKGPEALILAKLE